MRPGEGQGLPEELTMKVKVTQSCLTLCDPMDYTVHGILQARILEWNSISLLQGDLPRVLALGLAADTRLLGKTARL